MDKQRVVDRIRAELEAQLASLTQAAEAAHAAATHPDARAENQYDTRGLEASYLAGAQFGRVRELRSMVSTFKFFDPKPQVAGAPIVPGALVDLSWEGGAGRYFLAPDGRGLTLVVEGETIQVITPKSPIAAAVLGRLVGDTVEVELRDGIREYTIDAAH